MKPLDESNPRFLFVRERIGVKLNKKTNIKMEREQTEAQIM